MPAAMQAAPPAAAAMPAIRQLFPTPGAGLDAGGVGATRTAPGAPVLVAPLADGAVAAPGAATDGGAGATTGGGGGGGAGVASAACNDVISSMYPSISLRSFLVRFFAL